MNPLAVSIRPALLLLFALAIASPAAYLESDAGDAVTRPAPPPRILPLPLPGRDNPLVDLVRCIDIGEPFSYRGLTVYPLVLRNRGTVTDIVTLDEALSHGDLSIREKDNSQVSFVQVAPCGAGGCPGLAARKCSDCSTAFAAQTSTCATRPASAGCIASGVALRGPP